MKVLVAPDTCQHLMSQCLFTFNHSNVYEVISLHGILICISLKTNYITHIFVGLLAIPLSSLVLCLIEFCRVFDRIHQQNDLGLELSLGKVFDNELITLVDIQVF